MTEKSIEKKVCKGCSYYKRPKCNLKDVFTARKNTCKDFIKKKIKIEEKVNTIINKPISTKKTDKKFKKFLNLGTG